MNNTQTNINAAELLGLKACEHVKDVTFKCGCGKHQNIDIFANTPQGAWDREQVVIALGEKHGVFLAFDNGAWKVFLPPIPNDIPARHNTYEEAIAAAVNAVKGEQT